MSTEISYTTIALAIVTGGGLVAFLNGIVQLVLQKKLSKANTGSVAANTDISIGKTWQEYALQQQRDKEAADKVHEAQLAALKKDIEERITNLQKAHDAQIDELKQAFAKVIEGKDAEIKVLNDKNDELERRIDDLEAENERYASAMDTKVDQAKEKLHVAVETETDQIKSDIHSPNK